jgi:hypothetical protein
MMSLTCPARTWWIHVAVERAVSPASPEYASAQLTRQSTSVCNESGLGCGMACIQALTQSVGVLKRSRFRTDDAILAFVHSLYIGWLVRARARR